MLGLTQTQLLLGKILLCTSKRPLHYVSPLYSPFLRISVECNQCVKPKTGVNKSTSGGSRANYSMPWKYSGLALAFCLC